MRPEKLLWIQYILKFWCRCCRCCSWNEAEGRISLDKNKTQLRSNGNYLQWPLTNRIHVAVITFIIFSKCEPLGLVRFITKQNAIINSTRKTHPLAISFWNETNSSKRLLFLSSSSFFPHFLFQKQLNWFFSGREEIRQLYFDEREWLPFYLESLTHQYWKSHTTNKFQISYWP